MSMFHGQQIPEVSAVDAESGTGTPHVLLDVREADEWEAGHCADAQWVPLGELEGARFQLPMNRRIVCVCRSGARSARATETLLELGLRRREHGRRHEGLGRVGSPRRPCRRHARRGDLAAYSRRPTASP